MAKVIGEYIVSLRKDKEISQEDLARDSGLNQRSLRRIETGEVSVTVYSLSKLLQVLDEDITVFWRKVRKNLELMGEEEK
ncbi:helix-turn-helix transcriptional regulator [Phascolarctobacterium sp.]|uniref:helix-turn-helix domain-containing protein n=1 Tax=Phascolarctobacterium sp. TaxID=2049039 RepID=UPI0025DB860B|nr:helix-turn-helix transcriptional regulator [Phascolarctobacterium sp.]